MDYSKSAVNLTNHYSLLGMLRSLADSKTSLRAIEDKIEQLIPADLKALQEKYQDEIMQTTSDIQMTIEERGSYQDLEANLYAIKQRKVTKSYNAEAFEKCYPQYAPAVIIKAVDTTKLNGLIKGGLLTEDNLKNPDIGVITEKESFSYIIKVE